MQRANQQPRFDVRLAGVTLSALRPNCPTKPSDKAVHNDLLI